MYDVIVVGGRCAGATTAMLFARRGCRVLLLDRDVFPSETMSTLYIQQAGVERLARWGLLDAIVASGCPRLNEINYRIMGVKLKSAMPAFGVSDGTYAPRRRILDQILVAAAVQAGAEFEDRCSVVELLCRNGRVEGVRAVRRSGSVAAISARLVVGADGMRSTVAKHAGARDVVRDSPRSCVYYSVWRNLGASLRFVEDPGHWLAVIPTNDSLTILATYVHQERFATVRIDPWNAHKSVIAQTAVDIFDKILEMEPEEPLRGSGDQQNFFREASGPGWALVGDAGHSQDSITARGITDAFISAELLVDSVVDRLMDDDALTAASREYGLRRDAAFHDSYRAALTLAKLQVDEPRTAVMQAIAADPEQTRRFFCVMGGIMPMSEFLSSLPI